MYGEDGALLGGLAGGAARRVCRGAESAWNGAGRWPEQAKTGDAASAARGRAGRTLQRGCSERILWRASKRRREEPARDAHNMRLRLTALGSVLCAVLCLCVLVAPCRIVSQLNSDDPSSNENGDKHAGARAAAGGGERWRSARS